MSPRIPRNPALVEPERLLRVTLTVNDVLTGEEMSQVVVNAVPMKGFSYAWSDAQNGDFESFHVFMDYLERDENGRIATVRGRQGQ